MVEEIKDDGCTSDGTNIGVALSEEEILLSKKRETYRNVDSCESCVYGKNGTSNVLFCGLAMRPVPTILDFNLNAGATFSEMEEFNSALSDWEWDAMIVSSYGICDNFNTR